jgi:hypothetical protein
MELIVVGASMVHDERAPDLKLGLDIVLGHDSIHRRLVLGFYFGGFFQLLGQRGVGDEGNE